MCTLQVRIGPTPPYESSLPVEDRCRRDEERGPAPARNEAGEQHHEGAVRPGESRTIDLASEDRELVTQDQDLHVLRKGFHPVDADQLKGATRQAMRNEKATPSASLARRRTSNRVGE